MIGLWAMKTYGITAEAFIGWIRIARPGSILGPQQFYLQKMENLYLKGEAANQRSMMYTQALENSPQDKHKAMHGDKG